MPIAVVHVYRMRFNFHGVKLLWFASFCSFRVFAFAVAKYQAGEIKPCVSFRGVKRSRGWLLVRENHMKV